MAKFYVTNKKTVGRKAKAVISLAVTGAAVWFSIPGINYVRKKFDNWNAYDAVVEILEEQHFTEANTKLQDVKDRLTQEQINELEQKIAELHPDKLFANAQNMDPADKLEFILEIGKEYQALGVEKPELKVEYLTASLMNLRKQLSSDQNYQAVETLSNLLKDEFIFKFADKKVERLVEVSPESFDEVINSAAGNIRKFSGPARENIEQVIDLMVNLTNQLLPEYKGKCVAKLMEAYGEQVNSVLTANRYAWESEIKMLGSIRKTEKRYDYKIQVIDIEQTILNKITE